MEDYKTLFQKALICKQNNNPDEAEELYLKVLELEPDLTEAYYNLATIYYDRYDCQKAVDCYKKILEINPDDSEVKYFLSLAYFKMKNYAEGEKYFENRLCRKSSIMSQEKTYPNLTKSAPVYSGEIAKDKTVYTYYEAGFGDMIMFARYLPLLKERVGKVIFKPQKELVNLFKENNFGCEIMGIFQPENTIHFDYHIPIMSLPYALSLQGDGIFSLRGGYMHANPAKSAAYKAKYFDNDKFKIGIKWQGNTMYDRGRVITVESFFKLFDIPDTKFYSCQTFEGSQEIEKIKARYDIVDLGSTFKDFSDTAAALDNLDLIISNDSSLAHLAGALGKKCLVLLPYVYNWRWHTDLSICDWYESVKIFKQKTPDDWRGAFDDVYDFLINLLAKKCL